MVNLTYETLSWLFISFNYKDICSYVNVYRNQNYVYELSHIFK